MISFWKSPLFLSLPLNQSINFENKTAQGSQIKYSYKRIKEKSKIVKFRDDSLLSPFFNISIEIERIENASKLDTN